MKFSRDYAPGDVLSVHLVDGMSVQGSYQRTSRAYLHLYRHKIEAEGVFVESTAERLLVPRRLVKLVEVLGS